MQSLRDQQTQQATVAAVCVPCSAPERRVTSLIRRPPLTALARSFLGHWATERGRPATYGRLRSVVRYFSIAACLTFLDTILLLCARLTRSVFSTANGLTSTCKASPSRWSDKRGGSNSVCLTWRRRIVN